MNLPAAPAKEVFETLRAQAGQELISRGDAHVTVLTPPEFNSFKGSVTMADINRLAQQMGIQKSDLKPVCLGHGRANVDGKEEHVYFIVVKSENLLKIRAAIAAMVAKHGGETDGFRPEVFFPHITIGFTKMDLHAEQGVIKDARSCMLPLSVN
jgi:2'-5' RNA ligase